MPVNGPNVINPPKKPEDETARESSVDDQDIEREIVNSTSCTSDSEGEQAAEEAIRKQHLRLLEKRADTDELNEVVSTPLFTEPVRKYAHTLAKTSFASPFSQYGLLGGDISGNDKNVASDDHSDPRVYWNIAAPSSFFICGSQGSGKSHHLSCLLENALAPCAANILPRPLTGILFHYDTFVSDTGGSPCEAAWLSTNPKIKVRVLCPPTNLGTMKKLYGRFPNIHVQELRLNESDLDTKRMLNLMAVSVNGNMPLYMSVVNRILRDLRIKQQQNGQGFDYSAFKQMLASEPLTEMQLAPLKQRLETLESFMVEGQAKAFDLWAGRTGSYGTKPGPQQHKNPPPPPPSKIKRSKASSGIDWSPQHSRLTIVDLSCPCVTAEMACSLFNICLSLFLEQDSASVGRVVALDEAHKYMNESAECQMLTQALLETIRLQRHLGARVLISTQEPTISPKLLDLCSVTAVHRFTSPDWLNVLRKHIAGVSKGAEILERATRMAQREALAKDSEGATEEEQIKEIIDGVGTLNVQDAGGDPLMELFSKIVSLKVGEALIFAPSAIIGVRKKVSKSKEGDVVEESMGVQRLTHGVLRVRIRNRTTADGGKSIMAV
ncbi:hypothetical protein QBC37DRAFT_280832 [Rhypophila decipiens]|uniref:P-loop containing nucleoside triphosphate hydrolase protein n=1 Tax=Rhypophila decipiens TaxID=261697 RepID=A0AAN7B7R0_9PEZI|nr:hypothetical protein QBC37DRAFT_280832 [Rhypophila decipiens]